MSNDVRYARSEVMCPRCGRTVPGGGLARHCPQCGAALAIGYAATGSGEYGPYSVGTAYLLWALCIIGIAGIHRFYAGRYVTGVLWLLTWGLCGIGSFVDLFLIRGLIVRRNCEVAARI